MHAISKEITRALDVPFLQWSILVDSLGLACQGKRIFYLSVVGWQVEIPVANVKNVAGNCLPGILALIWALIQGRQRVRELLAGLVNWKTQAKWYVLSLAFPSSVFGISLCIVLIFYSTTTFKWPPMSLLITSLVTVPFGPFWEEIAWRGYALTELQSHYTRLTSALILGVYWAVWHIPLWMVTLNYLTATLLFIICINLVSWSVIFAFLHDRSGKSLPVVILLHATYLVVQNEVFGSVSYENIRLIPVSSALSVALAVVIGNFLQLSGRTCKVPTKGPMR